MRWDREHWPHLIIYKVIWSHLLPTHIVVIVIKTQRWQIIRSEVNSIDSESKEEEKKFDNKKKFYDNFTCILPIIHTSRTQHVSILEWIKPFKRRKEKKAFGWYFRATCNVHSGQTTLKTSLFGNSRSTYKSDATQTGGINDDNDWCWLNEIR